LRLAGVQDLDPQLAAEVAARYGAPWHGARYEELLRRPEVAAVVICTPNALHVPQARAALEAGKHVLVQKPLALSTDDARAVLECANRAGKLLFVDYSYRYLETSARLRAALSGLGRPRRVRASFHNIYGPGKGWFYDPALSGGGALIDLGVHLLDLGLDLFRPDVVCLGRAELSFAQGQAVEDAALLQLRLDDLPFELEVSWNAPRELTDISFTVEAERGVARWENVKGSFFHFRTLLDTSCLLDRETSLRSDTLRAFCQALATSTAPPVHLEVYDLLAQAYRTARPDC
jgi:predicted dehydrogenase